MEQEDDAINSKDVHAGGASRSARPWILLLAALLLVPMGYPAFRHEVSQWYLAVAKESQLDGDFVSAAGYAETAIGWAGENPDAYFMHITCSLQSGDAVRALPSCDRLVSLCRDRVENAKTASQESERSLLAMALNASAYSYALADKDLDKALAQIEECVELLSDKIGVAELDTLAYVYYLKGRHEEALVHADDALRVFEEHYYPVARAELAGLANNIMDQRKIEYEGRQLRDTRAVMYHHRGLIHQALGHSADAATDLARAEELGYDPEHGVW